MFEIPDDDDNFWEDLPLNDISNENVTPIKIPECELKKNQHSGFVQNNLNKRRCVEQPRENEGRQFPNLEIPSGQNVLSSIRKSDGGHHASKNHNNFQGLLSGSLRGPCLNIPPQPSRVLVPFTQEVALPRDPLLTRQRTPSGDTSVSDADLGSGDTSHNGRPSNKRKRKFPGPAGLLPRLGQGHTLDSPNISKVKEDVVSPEQVIEVKNMIRNNIVGAETISKTDLILSSQSGEEIFNDRPWQTLMRDLQDDGQDTLQRFSLASSLQKAKKKQLPRGKVLFVMAVIETLEWLGKDASVTLKDKSGSIQGTIHQSLMKEYECDLQPGSVLVLRQVSVISPTSRNHYLNITPANVVCVYCSKSEGLSRLRFVDKDKALPTVLKDLEREMMAELTPQRPGTNTAQSRLNMGTPDVRHPQSRLNMGTPNFRTPQSRTNIGTPDIRTPHSRLNMGTPDIRTPQSRFNVGNVGNNSATPPNSYPARARTPGVGLSGVQGAAVSRTGSFTPQRGPGQSGISGNNGANISGVGLTRHPAGVSLTNTGVFTPQNVTDRTFTPQRFSTPGPQQRTPQRGAAPVNQVPYGGTTPGNSTPQGGSAPGNRILQGGAPLGSVATTTPGVTNPYRFEPQNLGQNTPRSQNPTEGNQSNFRKSEAKSTVLSSSANVGVSSFIDSHVTGQCHVSSSSAASVSAPPGGVNTDTTCSYLTYNGSRSDNVSTTRVSPTNTTSSAENTPNRKGFRFKSTKSLTSPDNSLGSSIGQKQGSSAPGSSTIMGSVPSMPDSSKKANNGFESLWQDDLSDDLLSQLSEELV